MFKDFSPRELKYYFGFGFIFFIICSFLFINIFFSFIYQSQISLYLVLLIHDSFYILFYFLMIYLLAFFFRLHLGRTILFTVIQFYIYEYISGLFVEGTDYFIISPGVILLRIFILATGTALIYLVLRRIVNEKQSV
ncbi:MAG: hypothetical protein N3B13_02545 [Deltaproteobacteria bacterium]|nr:hypothetical protein [Deltaproteobacteria bacterium]